MLMEILAVVEKFPINNCVAPSKYGKKVSLNARVFYHLCSPIKPKRRYFHENREIYGKFPGIYRRFGKCSCINGNFACIDGNFPKMISYNNMVKFQDMEIFQGNNEVFENLPAKTDIFHATTIIVRKMVCGSNPAEVFKLEICCGKISITTNKFRYENFQT
jgi:hypothetical protein